MRSKGEHGDTIFINRRPNAFNEMPGQLENCGFYGNAGCNGGGRVEKSHTMRTKASTRTAYCSFAIGEIRRDG